MACFSIENVTRTTGRCTTITNNYAKGSSDIFKVRMEVFHPMFLLLHVKDAIGRR